MQSVKMIPALKREKKRDTTTPPCDNTNTRRAYTRTHERPGKNKRKGEKLTQVAVLYLKC